MTEKIETAKLADRIARTKRAHDAIGVKIEHEGSKYALKIPGAMNEKIDISAQFSVPCLRAVQAILKQAMKLDAAELAERTGLPAPKLEAEDQEVRVRMVQLALTEGEGPKELPDGES